MLRWLILPFLLGRWVHWIHLGSCVFVVIFLFLHSTRFPFLTSGSDLEDFLALFCPLLRDSDRHQTPMKGNNDQQSIRGKCSCIVFNTLMRRAATGSWNVWRQVQRLEMTCHPSQRKSLLPPLPQACLTSIISSLGKTQVHILVDWKRKKKTFSFFPWFGKSTPLPSPVVGINQCSVCYESTTCTGTISVSFLVHCKQMIIWNGSIGGLLVLKDPIDDLFPAFGMCHTLSRLIC